VVLAPELGSHPNRAARGANLVAVHRGAFVAVTQPVDADVVVAALQHTEQDRTWALIETAALWWHGLAPAPAVVMVGIPLGHKLAVRRPLRTRRVAASVLEGSRVIRGARVVALEVAVIQGAARARDAEVRELVEGLVRQRRTTLARLRGRGRRGLKGSARVRRVCDELAGGSMDADVRRLREALEARGVRGLECERRFLSAAGASAYADLFHEQTKTAFEVDGLVSHSERKRFRADRRRDRWMHRDHDVKTLRIDVLEIREDLDALADELAPFVLPRDCSRSA
jgi:hypothetical protein